MVKGFIKVWYIRFRVMTACNLPMSMRRLMASSEGGRNWVSERLRLFAWPCLFELGTKLGLNQGVHLPQEIEIVLAYHRWKTLLMQSPSNFEVELLLVRVSKRRMVPSGWCVPRIVRTSYRLFTWKQAVEHLRYRCWVYPVCHA